MNFSKKISSDLLNIHDFATRENARILGLSCEFLRKFVLNIHDLKVLNSTFLKVINNESALLDYDIP